MNDPWSFLNQHRKPRIPVWIKLVWVLQIALMIAATYVAAHFIAKWW